MKRRCRWRSPMLLLPPAAVATSASPSRGGACGPARMAQIGDVAAAEKGNSKKEATGVPVAAGKDVARGAPPAERPLGRRRGSGGGSSISSSAVTSRGPAALSVTAVPCAHAPALLRSPLADHLLHVCLRRRLLLLLCVCRAGGRVALPVGEDEEATATEQFMAVVDQAARAKEAGRAQVRPEGLVHPGPRGLPAKAVHMADRAGLVRPLYSGAHRG